MPKISMTMERLRSLALGLIVALNGVATVVSFGESYAGLYRWAVEHQITGIWAGVWPMMIDLMILVAEAALFVAHYDNWKMRHKAWLWSVMTTALAVSVGGNTGHIHSTDGLTHLTAALPPVALMFTMTVGFGIMKRTFMHKKPAETPPLIFPPITPETPSQPLTETSHAPLSETLSDVPEITAETSHESENEASQEYDDRLTNTLINLGYTTTEKSFTMPKDPRMELTLAEKRTRDMYDVDPDISVNAIATALGIAWATAKRYLEATKEARGLPA